MEVKRGDLIVASLPGDFRKLRPAVVVQDDAFSLTSLTVLPLTTDLRGTPSIRITIEASEETGLRERSQIMVDKVGTILRVRIRQRIGRLDTRIMQRVGVALSDFLGLHEHLG